MTITTGIYIISNVRRRNCIQLEDPNDRTPLKATPEQGTADEKWNVTRQRNGTYTIQNIGNTSCANTGSRSRVGDNVEGSTHPQSFVITETRVKGQYTIGTTDSKTFWSLADNESGTPLSLARSANDTSNWWTFRLSTNIKFPCSLIARNEQTWGSNSSSEDGDEEEYRRHYAGGREIDEDDNDGDYGEDGDENEDEDEDDADSGHHRRHNSRSYDSDDSEDSNESRAASSDSESEDEVIADSSDTIWIFTHYAGREFSIMNANNAQYIHPSRDNRKAVYQDGEYRWLVETRGFEHYVISTRINGDKIFWGCIEGMSPAVRLVPKNSGAVVVCEIKVIETGQAERFERDLPNFARLSTKDLIGYLDSMHPAILNGATKALRLAIKTVRAITQDLLKALIRILNSDDAEVKTEAATMISDPQFLSRLNSSQEAAPFRNTVILQALRSLLNSYDSSVKKAVTQLLQNTVALLVPLMEPNISEVLYPVLIGVLKDVLSIEGVAPVLAPKLVAEETAERIINCRDVGGMQTIIDSCQVLRLMGWLDDMDTFHVRWLLEYPDVHVQMEALKFLQAFKGELDDESILPKVLELGLTASDARIRKAAKVLLPKYKKCKH